MPTKKPKVTRSEIQQALLEEVNASIEKALAGFELDSKNPDANRRAFRAVVTVAAQRLLDMGCPPQVVLEQAYEAVVSEVRHRGLAALKNGQPFGLLPKASA